MEKNSRDRQPKIGEIYMMQFIGDYNEQNGWRPGLVFQNNVGNAYSPNIIALPLTTSLKKRGQPTHVIIPNSVTGLKASSMVLCENPERMSKRRIGRYLTTLPDEYMEKVAIASLLSSSAISYIDKDSLFLVWEQAVSLNSAG